MQSQCSKANSVQSSCCCVTVELYLDYQLTFFASSLFFVLASALLFSPSCCRLFDFNCLLQRCSGCFCTKTSRRETSWFLNVKGKRVTGMNLFFSDDLLNIHSNHFLYAPSARILVASSCVSYLADITNHCFALAIAHRRAAVKDSTLVA